jgi:hypothetical protein
MSGDPFATLASVRDFLSNQVLSVVPKEMASEVRAAAKLLQNVADEIDWLPAVLRAECEEMLALQSKTQEVIKVGISDDLRQQIIAPPGSIREQLELHRNMTEIVTTIVLKLQTRMRELSAETEESMNLRAVLDQYYEMLGRHAETRLRWQSVFTAKQSKASLPGPGAK